MTQRRYWADSEDREQNGATWELEGSLTREAGLVANFITAAPSGTGNHALQDYQMQLMLLEQQNKTRLIMARQELDSTTLDRNDRTLLFPRIPPSLQSDLRHGLLTPGATPPNPSSLTFSNSPSPLTNMSNAASFDPIFTGKTYNGPSPCSPPRGVGNPSPFRPQQPFQYLNGTYTSPPYCSNGYQEYPQNLQEMQFPTTNVLERANNLNTPIFLPPQEAYVALDPRLGKDCSPSNYSVESIESMISSNTNDTVDPDVLTPWDPWGEPPDFKNSCAYETKSKASTDSDISLEFQLAESMDVVDQFFGDCYRTSTSPPNKDLGLSASESSKFNLNPLLSQALTDRNLDMNTRHCPLEQAETPPKMGSRPQILSNVFQGHAQGADQSGHIEDESGTERREYQIPMTQNCNIASKPDCYEDIRLTVGVPPLPCATRSVSYTTLGQVLTCYQRQTFSPSSMSASGSETCSWSSDNDTDWGDDESDNEHRNIGTPVIIEGSNMLAEQELPNLVTKPVLSKLKQELVGRIMVEFWQIFNEEKEINIYEDTISQSTHLHQCQEPDTSSQEEQNTTPMPKSRAKSDVQTNGTHPIGGQNGKRKRQGQDDDENDETENRNPKRPKGLLSPPLNQDDTSKFACPYRKRDARKYCVRQWRSCALTPLETVARVKGHLYRHHRIFPCPRCKTLFNDQQKVNDHLKESKGCELLEVVQKDGITNEIVEKLRSKKKAHRDQSEKDRWKEIYQILFPGEMVPSPFFEEIQEDVIQSPDSQELAEYEEYCRQELPRVFRTSLEEIVNNNTQPLEEQLRGQLVDLIRDAQDRVFSSYRSSSLTTTGTPARGAPSSSPQTVIFSSLSQGFSTSSLRSQPTIGSLGDRSRARLPAFFQPPSPQNHLESSLDISDRNITPSKPDRNNRSDSGYNSSPFALPSTLPLSPGDSTVNTSISSFQTLPLLEMNQEKTSHANNEVALTQAKLDSNAGATTGSGNGHLNSELYLSQNTFDFDLNSVDLSNFDMENFRNCDVSQNLDGFFSLD